MKRPKQNPALRKANAELEAELKKQIARVIPAAAILLWRKGWRKLRIGRRLVTAMEVWGECADAGDKKSMMQMLEEETGIEIQLTGYDKSFHELSYLDAKAWDGHAPSVPELIYIRHQQKKWIAPQILAAICISMYRDEHIGVDRIAEFIVAVNSFMDAHGDRLSEYREILEKETEFEFGELCEKVGR